MLARVENVANRHPFISLRQKLSRGLLPVIRHVKKRSGDEINSTHKARESPIGIQQPQATGSAITKLEVAPTACKRSTFCFLDLPYEIRNLVYIESFSTQTLEVFSKDEGSTSYAYSPRSFRPVQDTPSSHGLLLANHQCYNEGIKLYYQHCTALHANCIPEWQINMTPGIPQRAHSEEQHSVVKCKCARQCKDKDVILAKGLTSNAPSVIESTRRIVSESRRLYIDQLSHLKSLQEVVIKMPRMEWDHWPELQQTIPPDTRPSDDQLRHYHEGVLPTYEPARRFVKGLRRRTHVGNQETMEADLLMVMRSMPQVSFRARIPVTYKYDDQQVWEICEYDLRDLRLTSRRVVPHVEILKEKFPEPDYSDHNYCYYN